MRFWGLDLLSLLFKLQILKLVYRKSWMFLALTVRLPWSKFTNLCIRVFLKRTFMNHNIWNLATSSPKTSSFISIFYFNGFTTNSNSCTANDRNRRIQISSQWRLRKCKPYFIRPRFAAMGSSSFKSHAQFRVHLAE